MELACVCYTTSGINPWSSHPQNAQSRHCHYRRRRRRSLARHHSPPSVPADHRRPSLCKRRLRPMSVPCPRHQYHLHRLVPSLFPEQEPSCPGQRCVLHRLSRPTPILVHLPHQLLFFFFGSLGLARTANILAHTFELGKHLRAICSTRVRRSAIVVCALPSTLRQTKAATGVRRASPRHACSPPITRRILPMTTNEVGNTDLRPRAKSRRTSVGTRARLSSFQDRLSSPVYRFGAQAGEPKIPDSFWLRPGGGDRCVPSCEA
ncbi:hypothetical protein BGW80DRAFT_507955 [Lactifluus volemus]|nr:hypothetical protein BGW80DRAFT_507955 [Lactifluus volemus]